MALEATATKIRTSLGFFDDLGGCDSPPLGLWGLMMTPLLFLINFVSLNAKSFS